MAANVLQPDLLQAFSSLINQLGEDKVSEILNKPVSPVYIEPKVKFVCLDIETADAPIEAVESQLNNWKPPSNYKDADKIEAKRKEDFDKIMNRAALLDASPIVCACFATDRGNTAFVISPKPIIIEKWECFNFEDETNLLVMLGIWLNNVTDDDTNLVGHNIKGFDLPKLRNAYIRHRLKLPNCFKPFHDDDTRQPVADTAKMFQYFSMEHRNNMYPSLDDMCNSLGITRPKSVISGEDVPRLFKEGKVQEIATYCAIDVMATLEAYNLMA